MSRKSEVTIRACHMISMNAIFDRRGTHSCAVDAFIEVSTELFLPHLSNLSIRNELTALLFSACSGYVQSRESRSLQREIREPVWSYMCRATTGKGCPEACQRD